MMINLPALALVLVFVTLALWVLYGEVVLVHRFKRTPLDDRDLTARRRR